MWGNKKKKSICVPRCLEEVPQAEAKTSLTQTRVRFLKMQRRDRGERHHKRIHHMLV